MRIVLAHKSVIVRIVLTHKRVIVRIALAHKWVIVRIVLDHNRRDCQENVGSLLECLFGQCCLKSG
jgi:hypothetical protein